jgi:hypothetical protein
MDWTTTARRECRSDLASSSTGLGFATPLDNCARKGRFCRLIENWKPAQVDAATAQHSAIDVDTNARIMEWNVVSSKIGYRLNVVRHDSFVFSRADESICRTRFIGNHTRPAGWCAPRRRSHSVSFQPLHTAPLAAAQWQSQCDLCDGWLYNVETSCHRGTKRGSRGAVERSSGGSSGHTHCGNRTGHDTVARYVLVCWNLLIFVFSFGSSPLISSISFQMKKTIVGIT